MRLLDVYNKYLVEANLKNLYTKSVNETPKMASRGQQLKGRVRYFGLSKDGTLNFKIASQSISGRFYYAYIEAPDIIKFSDIIEEGDHFTLADLNRLLTMDGFRVYCSCPAHLYWSFQYMATMGGYEIEPETRAPKRNNVLLQGALDKHLIAVVDNIYNNQSIRDSIVKDIDNYLRMLNGLDYEDYQQLNHARQIQQQNRAVKWKNNPTDYMNDYFARQAKNHQFLDDHDIRHSLKVEGNKFAKANPNATVDDFLRSYFNMTQKAFAEEMKIPESSVEDYFNELGFNKAQEKGLAKQQSNNQGLTSNILTKDSEQVSSLNESNYAYAEDVTNEELNNNKCKFVTYGTAGKHEVEFDNLKELFKYIDQCGGFNQFKGIQWFITSDYKNGEFYYVRHPYAKGGWIWEDVNGNPVKFEYRSIRNNESGEPITHKIIEIPKTSLLENEINNIPKLSPSEIADLEEKSKHTQYFNPSITSMVDIDILDKFREYDRTKMMNHTPESLNKLVNSIKENGFYPVMLEYNPSTGFVKLGEGNHRLAIAKQLGLSKLPAVASRNKYLNPEASEGGYVNPKGITPDYVDKFGPVYASVMKPELLGEPFGPNYKNISESELSIDSLQEKYKEYLKYPISKYRYRLYPDDKRSKYITKYSCDVALPNKKYHTTITADSLEKLDEQLNSLTNHLKESDEPKEYYTPSEAHAAYQEYLTGHIQNVKDIIELIIDTFKDDEFIQDEKESLRNIASQHDASKYGEQEYIPYLHHFYPTRPEDELKSEEFEKACRHHILHNKHHWDFWLEPGTLKLKDIPDNDREYKLYCIERVADWLAMGAQHGEDKMSWYDANKDSILMPDWAFEFIDYLFSKLPDDYYLSCSFKGTRGKLDESTDDAIFPDSIDRSNVYVHTTRPIKSAFPSLGKGYYLFQINSVAPEINKSVLEGNNKYYTINNAADILVINDINDPSSELPSDLVNDLKEILGPEINNMSVGEVLRKLSKEADDSYVSEFMKSHKVDGIQILNDSKLYSEPVTNETLIYNMNVLDEVTPINA